MERIPALDGIRAIAIAGVLAYHVYPPGLPGGFTGVDVFFVLSGFLITSVIVHDLQLKQFTMREFYLRRIQRLLPNAALTVGCTMLLAMLILPPFRLRMTALNGLSAIFELSNLFIWRTFGGYWGDSAVSAPLLHTWSLGLEEQFYMLFPAILLLFVRRKRPILFLTLLSFASLALCLWETGVHPDAAFYLLPSRAWELLMGAAFAALLMQGNSNGVPRRLPSLRLFSILGWLGMGMICAGFFFIPGSAAFPGAWAMIPTFGSLAVLISVMAETGPALLMTWRPFTYLGQTSYSIYLWHWPLIVLATDWAVRNGLPQRRYGAAPGAVISVILAIAAYHLVERPLRQRGPGRGRRLVMVGSVVSMAALGCMLLALKRPIADPFHLFDQPTFSGASYNVIAEDGDPTGGANRLYDVKHPPARR